MCVPSGGAACIKNVWELKPGDQNWSILDMNCSSIMHICTHIHTHTHTALGVFWGQFLLFNTASTPNAYNYTQHHMSLMGFYSPYCTVQAVHFPMQLHTGAEHFGNVIFRYSELTSQYHIDASKDVYHTWWACDKTIVSQSGIVAVWNSFER